MVIVGDHYCKRRTTPEAEDQVSRSILHLIEWKTDRAFEEIRSSQTSFNVASGSLSDWLHLQSKKIGPSKQCGRDRQVHCLL
jgi:hypothetical protein